MATRRIGSLDDPRLAVFRNLQKRPTARCADEHHFVVEGKLVVQRLIASDHKVDTVIVQEGRPVDVLGKIPEDVSLFELTRDQIHEISGFDFHRGYLASAIRPAVVGIEQFLPDPVSLAAIQVTDMENLGSMLRSASAFGVRQILFDDATADLFSRRVLRVSMGAALRMRFLGLQSPAEEFSELMRRGIHSWAATLSDDSVAIRSQPVPEVPLVIIVGNEAKGLPRDVQRAASARVKIAMPSQQDAAVDSLNVAVAASILMHEVCGR